MALTLVEKLDKIFYTKTHFDICGICLPELVSPDLARELTEVCRTEEGRKRLNRRGYLVHMFGPECESGMIGKWIHLGKKSDQYLKLYWDQRFPKEIERMKQDGRCDTGAGKDDEVTE